MAECAKLDGEGNWRHLHNVDLPMDDGVWRFDPFVRDRPTDEWDLDERGVQIISATPEQIEVRRLPLRHRRHVGGGIWAKKTAEEIAQAEAELEAALTAAKVARLDENTVIRCMMFRSLLQKYFGPGAETNRDITAEVVEGFFVQALPDATTIRDGIVLSRLFDDLHTWNGTDETWTIPWEAIPAWEA